MIKRTKLFVKCYLLRFLFTFPAEEEKNAFNKLRIIVSSTIRQCYLLVLTSFIWIKDNRIPISTHFLFAVLLNVGFFLYVNRFGLNGENIVFVCFRWFLSLSTWICQIIFRTKIISVRFRYIQETVSWWGKRYVKHRHTTRWFSRWLKISTN